MTHAASPDSQPDSLSTLKARIQQNPHEGAAWLAMAQILARTRTGPELRQAISKSIELLPDDYQAWLLAGLEMQHSRGAAAALQWLQRITQQRPHLAAPRLVKAQLLTAVEAESASEQFLAVIRDFPDDSRAHLLYAEHLQNLGQLHSAGDQLEAALEIKPELAENWTALARIRLAVNRLDEVVKAASRALEIDSEDAVARLTRAEACRQAAQWQMALEDYRVLQQHMPENPYVLMGLGACLAGKGDFDAALQYLQKAVQIKNDLTEAHFNIALVLASQTKALEANAVLDGVLQENRLEPGLREAALITQASLQEQLRLPTYLQQAGQTEELVGLQQALQLAPEILLESDARTEDHLRAMAKASQLPDWQLQDVTNDLEVHQAAFVEACLLSRSAENVTDMFRLWQTIQQHELGKGLLDSAEQNLRDAWKAVIDRRRMGEVQFGSESGEAWLRYWHYRLFSGSPGSLPGIFKIAPNSIGLHRTTAPQHLIRTVRCLFEEIYPSLPAGPGRAAFILSAISRIHAFIDGNGRLSRFMFCWELEKAGLAPVLWTRALRKTLAHCLDQAQYDNDFTAFRQSLLEVQGSSSALLSDFSEKLAKA